MEIVIKLSQFLLSLSLLIILHELGHFIGLPHSYVSASSIMRPTLASYQTFRQVYTSDVNALSALYGSQALTAGSARLGAMSDGPSSEGEMVRGRIELRTDGRCLHFQNGVLKNEHRWK